MFALIAEVLDSFIDWLSGLNPAMVVTVVALLAFAEGGAVMGIIAPGEVTVLLCGFLIDQGRVPFGPAAIAITLASFLGDQLGYFLGHRYGDTFKRSWIGSKVGDARWEKATEFLHGRGQAAVFLGKFVGFMRALLPFTAGMSRYPYKKFVVINALSCLILIPGTLWLGVLAGGSYEKVHEWIGRSGWGVLALVAVIWGVHHLRSRQRERLLGQVE